MIEAVSRASFSPAVMSGGGIATQPVQSPHTDFSVVLKSLASDTVGTIRSGEAAAVAGITGTMPVQQVVEKVLAAERALQTMLAIRDKTVSAYLEISRMQI
jgi:flagellar hook-basal body complex protein FliE